MEAFFYCLPEFSAYKNPNMKIERGKRILEQLTEVGMPVNTKNPSNGT